MWPVSIAWQKPLQKQPPKKPPSQRVCLYRKNDITKFEPPPIPCPGRLSGNPAWSIDGFRTVANPLYVFHATVVLSRASKKAGFKVWLKKKSRKRRLKNNLLILILRPVILHPDCKFKTKKQLFLEIFLRILFDFMDVNFFSGIRLHLTGVLTGTL